MSKQEKRKQNIDEEFSRRRPRVSNSAIEISRGVAETTLGIAPVVVNGGVKTLAQVDLQGIFIEEGIAAE